MTKKTVVVCVCCLFAVASLAQQMNGYEIMIKNDKQFDVSSEESTISMELLNSNGKKRNRSISRSTKMDKDRNTKMLIRFISPADVKGSGYLYVEHDDNTKSRYLYLPTLKKSRRISAGEDSDYFMGTDFTYEDLSDIDFNMHEFKLSGDETIDNIPCYKVDVLLKHTANKNNSGYSKRIYYIDKKIFVVHKIEYFDKQGSLFKTLMQKDVKLVKNPDIYRAHTWIMKNNKTKHQTTLLFQNFKIDEPIEDDVFTVRNLEKFN